MIYRTLIFVIGLFLLDIVTAPLDDYSQRREVRGQTGQESEDAGEDGSLPEDGIVNLQGSINITDLILAVSEINDETYVLDGSVHPGEISIVTPGGGLRKEDVLSLFETVLRMNGLSVVKSDGINKVVNTSDIKGSATPVETEKQN
jgi:type II secretory pathway component GspD/PulD (secretin)